MALGTDNIEDEFVIDHKWDQLDFLPARRVDDEEDDDDEFESEDEVIREPCMISNLSLSML